MGPTRSDHNKRLITLTVVTIGNRNVYYIVLKFEILKLFLINIHSVLPVTGTIGNCLSLQQNIIQIKFKPFANGSC